ncbi:MAG: TonB-dependent hemoglobin/transferrin/lactoferrin family receptor, partial [Synechococcus sp. SB0669_bin_8]|nr:TonB-dependent hemoglobin/transferrin/lactoferrin family receptor [Synechococcus sp. SB0669_bin_8]
MFLHQHVLASPPKGLASFLVLALGLSLSVGGPAQGQEQPDTSDDDVELPEIKVFGAARDGRNLLETPSAVTVIDGEDMDRLQPSNYEDLLIDVPGLVIQGGRGVAQEPNIRGFQDEQVVIRVDGVRQNFNLQHRGRFFVDPSLLKQVEVLRGGASAMFGSGALGGVISLETKDTSDILKPGETWGSQVNVGFNSQGSQTLRAVTAAFAQENLDMVAFFSQRLMPIDPEDGNNVKILDSAVDNLNGMVKMTMIPNDDHKLSIDGRIYTDSGQVPNTANQDTNVENDEDNNRNRVADRNLDHQQYRIKWNYTPSNNELINLSTLVYYNETRVEETNLGLDTSRDGGRFDTTKMATIGVDITNSSDINFGEIPVALAYGLEFFKDDHRATRDENDRPESPTAQRSFYAGFAQAELSLSPKFTLSSGLRYDAFTLDPPDHMESGKEFQQRKESSLSPWLGLNWQPLDHLQFFTIVSQAFRAPSLTEMYAQGTHFIGPVFDEGQVVLRQVPVIGRDGQPAMRPVIGQNGRPVLDPITNRPLTMPVTRPAGPDLQPNVFQPNEDLKSEKATQIEIGTRYQRSNIIASGDQLLLSANAYYIAVDDYIESFVNNDINNNITSTRNVNAELSGFEAEMAYNARSWFTSANLTIPRGSEEGCSGQLYSIPQDRFSVTLGLRPDPKWEVGLRSTVAGERKINDNESDSRNTDSFVTFDLFANLRLGDDPSSDALLSFGIDNITNQKYKLHPNVLHSPG